MLAEIQGSVLDFLHRAGLSDADGFATEAAVQYLSTRARGGDPQTALRRIRTSSFSSRRHERTELTRGLIAHLDRRFMRKITRAEESFARAQSTLPHATVPAKETIDPAKKLTTELVRFKKAVEARSVADFWIKRSTGVLKNRPERIGQSLLTLFLAAVLRTPKQGTVLNEVRSGIGFIDVMVFLRTSEPLIVELKVLTTGNARGTNQLRTYLRTEGARTGWLVIFDARKGGQPIVEGSDVKEGITIHIITVGINPPAPSSLG